MYATLLARAYTGRTRVLKVGGGWHGAQPWALKGVYFAESGAQPWVVESQGLPGGAAEEVIISRYNDSDMLRDHFEQHGDQLSCFIVEPFIGSGGYILANPEYLRTARQLADQYGVVLIFDEVISGFRFRAGDLGGMYTIRPDLATFAKIIGGGMPVAAIAGRAEVMRMCAKVGGKTRVSGGTYAGHAASLFAAKTMLEYLIAHEDGVYPRIAALGETLRRTTEQIFAAEGIHVRCTGYPNAVVPGSSMAMPHFAFDPNHPLISPDDVNDPAICDHTLREKVFQLALLCEDVHVVHGLGAVSTAHTEEDLRFYAGAIERVAHRLKPYLS
jgi:glutamate-1-semialdehyde 2,1-aminomutase